VLLILILIVSVKFVSGNVGQRPKSSRQTNKPDEQAGFVLLDKRGSESGRSLPQKETVFLFLPHSSHRAVRHL